MIRGRDTITVDGESMRCHVSWTKSEDTVTEAQHRYLTTYLTVTYLPSKTIAHGAVVTYRGDTYETMGPEQYHTDMQGKPSHKTRELKWVNPV